MKLKIEDRKPCQKVLKISLPSDVLKAAHQKVVLEFQAKSQIPGFRLGKAPLKNVESRFAQEIKSEVLRQWLPKVCREAIEKEKIKAISDPVAGEIEYDLEKGLSFEAVVEVSPEVELPKYKGMKLEKEPVAVTEDEVNQAIENLKEHHAVFHPVEGRPLDYGDYALVDYAKVGAKGQNDNRKNVLVALQEKGKNALADQLVGMEAGQSRKVNVGAEGSSQVFFNVKLNEIKERRLPELDDDFLKNLGEAKSLDELKVKIRSDLQAYKEKGAQGALKNKALRTLAETCDFDIPESQVRQEMQNVYSELVNRIRQGAVSSKSLEDEALKKELEMEARQRVKTAYLLHEIGLKEDLKVSDEELAQEISKMAAHLGKSAEELKAGLEKEKRLEFLRARLAQDKTIDFILGHAIIKNSG